MLAKFPDPDAVPGPGPPGGLGARRGPTGFPPAGFPPAGFPGPGRGPASAALALAAQAALPGAHRPRIPLVVGSVTHRVTVAQEMLP
ncbi:MAG TPA: hypothetical protein VK594_03680 [Streptosporangiaceae bacterium]|nr:hypothetical protein [Streptosporangiaceae bacterium]